MMSVCRAIDGLASQPPTACRMKVLLASWSPFMGGAEVAAERLARGLSEKGHDVVTLVGTDGEALQRMKELGVRCVHLPLQMTDKWRWWRYARVQRSLRRLLTHERPDLVHSNDLPTHQMVSQAAGRLGLPRICHHRWIFAGAAIDWLNKFDAEHHLFVSQALRDQLHRASPRLAARPGRVVYDGLLLPMLPSPKERIEARKQLGLPLEKTIVLFAGQIVPRKGVADLLQAWMLMDKGTRDQAELAIVGDDLEGQGEYRTEMQRLADELACRARFVGFQRNVPMWLTASDIAVVPSHAEPLGNATLEAMSYGLPVIGCSVGGIPEMVCDQETGRLVPAQQPPQLAVALHSLITDAGKRQQMGLKGRQRCDEKFSLNAHVDAVVDEYRSVVHRLQGLR